MLETVQPLPGLARFKKFTLDDENQFMEIKSVITQELELILTVTDGAQVSRDDVHTLMAAVPSMRFLSESNEAALRSIENQWHKLFISWQSILGQMKVQQKKNGEQRFPRGAGGKIVARSSVGRVLNSSWLFGSNDASRRGRGRELNIPKPGFTQKLLHFPCSVASSFRRVHQHRGILRHVERARFCFVQMRVVNQQRAAGRKRRK